MQKFYYIAGAMILVVGGLGAYSSQAGNKMMSDPSAEYVEEIIVYTVSPQDQNSPQNSEDDMNNQNPQGGFVPLPDDKGVEVAPIPENNMQNPSLEQNKPADITVEESVTETMNWNAY